MTAWDETADELTALVSEGLPDYSDVLERIATALERIADAQESRAPRVPPAGFMR